MVKKIIIDSSDFGITDRNVACIGFFDGFHRGHQELIYSVIDYAKKHNIRSSVICFDPDPNDIITGFKNKHIFSFKERINILSNYDIDQLIIIRFNESLMKMKPELFINEYLNKMNLEKLICGFDFSFGYKGSGNSKLLRKYGNFKLEVIPEKTYYGKKISSTRIKETIKSGNFRLVDKLLGFNYYLNLKIIKQAENGSKWSIEAKPSEKDIVTPDNMTVNNHLKIKDGIFYLESKNKIESDTFKLSL